MRQDTDKKILFSIILCTYNREKHIKRCLESLLSQDYPKEKFEVIVVDDGSTDATTSIVEKYPVTLIKHEKNKGTAGARNTGLAAAKGKVYVCFDDDCIADTQWLSKLAQIYEEYPEEELLGACGFIQLLKKNTVIDVYMDEIGYANPSPLIYGKSKNIFGRFISYIKNMFSPQIQSSEKRLEVNEIWGANCSFPVKLLKEINGWDEKLSGVEDTDLCDRLKKKFKNKKFICTKDAILYHDHKLSVKGFLLKPYSRGTATMKFYQKKHMIPPFFPFPIVILGLSLGISYFNYILGISLLLVLPQIFYSWWGIKAIKKRTIKIFLFPYLQFGYELFSLGGLLRGYVKEALNLSTRKILFLILLFCIYVNWLIFKENSSSLIRIISSLLYIFFIPGILISWTAKVKYINIWEFIINTLGLSIVTIMVLGLGVSLLFPKIAYGFPVIPSVYFNQPLSLTSFLITLDSILGLLWIYIFGKNISFPIIRSKFSYSVLNIIFGIFSTLFPLLAIFGAININNNQSNILTMIMLGGIATFVLLLTILRNKVSSHLFTYSLFSMALSLLFMTSLRGWYITGHDIFLEYFVFQITKAQGIWQMSNFQDPYTACLSITILPTIISNITHINDLYIYKIIYQIIFSFSIVTTFIFMKRFVNPFFAFLGSFAIISLPTFMTDMPMLNRQEIALFFFALLLYTLFSKFSTKVKWFLFFAFGIGLLLSHYSTTYISISLFIGGFLVYAVFRVLKFHPKLKSVIKWIDAKLGIVDNKQNLRLELVILLLLATLFWNVNITHTANGLMSTINNISKDFKTLHFAKQKSDPGAYGLLSNKTPTPQALLDTYVSTTTQFVRKFNANSAFLDEAIYNQFPVSVGSQVKQPLTNIGEFLNKYKINVFKLNDNLKQTYAKVIELFIVLGFVAIFFFKKHISNLEKEYLAFTVTFFVILVVQLVLPSGAIDYGILRLFQQGLILFSIPMIMGGLAIFSIFNFIHKDIKIYLVSLVLIFFFLYLSGFIPQITGGYYPQLNLSNAGFYYDAYYTHSQDLVGMGWLNTNRNTNTPVQSDWFTLKKIHTYEHFYSIDGLIPSVIRKNSYVFLSVNNTQTGEVIIYANGAPLYYKYDFSVLEENKNLIYNNGGVKIYR